MPLDRAARRALDHLDEDALVTSLAELVRIPSVTGSPAESELQHRYAGWLAELEMDVDLWPFDLVALQADPRFPGMEVERREGWGVAAMLGSREGSEAPALILQGHVDVVPAGDAAAWRHPPFAAAIEGRRLFGRGACDMKAGVAANFAVARALHRSGLVLERPLAVHAVVGEEDGGVGAFATLLRGHTGDAAVITEPTAGRLVTAAAGALTFRIEVPGLAAHGSTRTSGQSAIDAYLPIHRALADLEAARNADVDRQFTGTDLPYAISVGVVRAGEWSSTVPDALVAEGRYGVRLGEPLGAARAQLERAVSTAAAAHPWLAEHPPQVTWPGGQFASGQLPDGHPLAGELQTAATDTGSPCPQPFAAPYGSDLRLYAGLDGTPGIPTLHYGPGDIGVAHATDEYVDLDEVVAVARALTVLAVRRCHAHT